MKIFLYYIGKQRDEHANGRAEEDPRRASRYARVEMREIQPARFDPWEKHSSAAKILLDPAGKAMNSQQFAQLIATGEREGRDLVFLVGGASGLPDSWRDRGGRLVSLSALTFPHELARVLAGEALYP